MCCGSVLSMVLRILFLPLIPLAYWFQNPGDVATLHALRPLLFCFIFYSMGIEQRKPWIRKKSRVGHLGVPSHLPRQQNSRANTNQESLTRVWHVQFSYTIIYKKFFLKLTPLFTFYLKKIYTVLISQKLAILKCPSPLVCSF